MASHKQREVERTASPQRAELVELATALVNYLDGDQERELTDRALADDGNVDSTSPPVAIFNAGFLETGRLYKMKIPVLVLPEPAHHTRMWVGAEGNEKRWHYVGHANNSSASQWAMEDYRPGTDLSVVFHLRSQQAEHEHLNGVQDPPPLYYPQTPPAYHPPSRTRSSSPLPDQSASSPPAIVSDTDRGIHMSQIRAFLNWMDAGFKFRGCGWADQRIQIDYRRQGEGRGSSSKRDILELVVRLKGIWRLTELTNAPLGQADRAFYVFGLPGVDFPEGDKTASALRCPLHEYKDASGHHPFASPDGDRLFDEWTFSPSTGRKLDRKGRLVATTWSVKSTCARGMGMSVVFEVDNPHEVQSRGAQGVLGRIFRS
ncbi:hypothetical protein JCM8208_001463 [Rhodotorula glutinis]